MSGHATLCTSALRRRKQSFQPLTPVTLANVLGRDRALELAKLAARLTGLQHYRRMAEAVNGQNGGPVEAAHFLAAMFEGMGDICVIEDSPNGTCLIQREPRIVRGLSGDERDELLLCWIEIWRGAVQSHRAFMDVAATRMDDTLLWTIVECEVAASLPSLKARS